MTKFYQRLFFLLPLLFSYEACAGTWTYMTIPFVGAQAPLLLTDGSVMVLDRTTPTGNVWKLTPDNTGNYATGTWTQLASLPTGYSPIFFASAVLPDGRVIYEGGEYNAGSPNPVDTDLGAIYDPVANIWTPVTAPAFFTNGIGDASSIVLPDGTFMLADIFYDIGDTVAGALLDESALTWSQTGSGKADSNDEEGWTLLPNGKVLTVDVYVGSATPPANRTNTELYDPATGTWSTGGQTLVPLAEPNTFEIGPQVLRPDGTVFVCGGNGNTGIYDALAGIWSTGPMMPVTVDGQMACQDAPGALLPNGNVFFIASVLSTSTVNDNGTPPSHAFEFDGTSYTQEPDHTLFATFTASQFIMLVLPTGQIMVTNIDTNTLAIYTPSDTNFNDAWRPIIYCLPKKVRAGKSYQISGSLFNGMSQGAMFGDDWQTATNYPLVRITNNATGHVFYCRTHDHSYMGVAATNFKVSTTFDVPAGIELGKSTLEVVANGIPSQPHCIYVASATC